jgi:uncharacterized protein YkwD
MSRSAPLSNRPLRVAGLTRWCTQAAAWNLDFGIWNFRARRARQALLLLIISIMKRLALFLVAAVLSLPFLCCGSAQASDGGSSLAAAVVREMNLARTNPALYATYLEELRDSYQGDVLIRPGKPALRTNEGVRGLDDAIRFLRSTAPRQPLQFSPGMSRGAADHVAAQAGGGMSHRAGGSTSSRISRYGMWSGSWAENISCGKSTAREIVIALIIDDGLRARKHRKNIFNPAFSVAGAAVGPHARYRTICSMNFAGGYVEYGGAPADRLVARN